MPTSATNIDELLSTINQTESVLRSNSIIIDEVTENGGDVLYSYNNVVIVSNISEELYNNLLKNDNIIFMQDLPLKQYGEINYGLVSQLDSTTLSNYSTSDNIEFNLSNLIATGTTSDVKYGKSKKSILEGVPSITNETLSLSALTNEWFTYTLYSNGTKPISFSVVKPSNYIGSLSIINGNVLKGQTSDSGIYNITIKAVNDIGTDSKNITLTTYDPIVITNTNLTPYAKIGTPFNYTIESAGSSPKTYSITGLTSGLTFENGIISGTFYSGETYDLAIEVSNLISSDSIDLTITSIGTPNITSSGQVSSPQYSEFTYIITSEYQDTTTFKVIGILPEGLSFKEDTISGIPIRSGSYDLVLYATNPVGSKTLSLNIIITDI